MGQREDFLWIKGKLYRICRHGVTHRLQLKFFRSQKISWNNIKLTHLFDKFHAKKGPSRISLIKYLCLVLWLLLLMRLFGVKLKEQQSMTPHLRRRLRRTLQSMNDILGMMIILEKHTGCGSDDMVNIFQSSIILTL